MMRLFAYVMMLAASGVDGFVSVARRPLSKPLRASAADCEALSARLSDAQVVEDLFLVKGELRQFLRRDQFTAALVAANGPPLSEDAAYECWLGLGGAPRPAEQKKEKQGFFASFASSIAANAAGSVDTRPKDKWGDTIPEMTIIDKLLILTAPDGARDFSPAGVAALLESAASATDYLKTAGPGSAKK